MNLKTHSINFSLLALFAGLLTGGIMLFPRSSHAAGLALDVRGTLLCQDSGGRSVSLRTIQKPNGKETSALYQVVGAPDMVSGDMALQMDGSRLVLRQDTGRFYLTIDYAVNSDPQALFNDLRTVFENSRQESGLVKNLQPIKAEWQFYSRIGGDIKLSPRIFYLDCSVVL